MAAMAESFYVSGAFAFDADLQNLSLSARGLYAVLWSFCTGPMHPTRDGTFASVTVGLLGSHHGDDGEEAWAALHELEAAGLVVTEGNVYRLPKWEDVKPPRRRRKPLDDVPSPEFDEFWDLYPKPTGKQEAKRAYLAALTRPGVTHETLLDGLRRHLGPWETYPTLYIPNGSTWLNQQRYLDDAPAPRDDGRRPTRAEGARDTTRYFEERERAQQRGIEQ